MTPCLYRRMISDRSRLAHVKLVWRVSRAEAVGGGDRDPVPLYNGIRSLQHMCMINNCCDGFIAGFTAITGRLATRSIYDFRLQNLIFPITTPNRYQSHGPILPIREV